MKTVGSILKRARLEKDFSFKEISKVLKIHSKFLKALEEGNYEIFSDSVHIKGFLKNYADFLGLNAPKILAFWRREYDEEKGEKIKVLKPLEAPRLVLTPGVVIAATAFFLIVGFFSYLFYQYRSFAAAPFLIVEEPSSDITLHSPSLNVVGRADKDAELFINGQKVTLGEKGTFAVTISLSEGVNDLNFLAINKLGKKTKITRTVVVEWEKEEKKVVSEATPSAELGEGLELEIKIEPEASWLEVFADEKKVFSGVVLSGVSKKFKAREKIELKTGNAGATEVILNGKNLGKLGKEGEVVEKVFEIER